MTTKVSKSPAVHPTRISLSEETRASVIEVLQKHLFSAIDLTLQCKQAHWNVRGPHFMSLHLFFDKLHEIAEGFVDLLAERAAALGAAPDGTVGNVAKQTALNAYPRNIVDGKDHLTALSDAFSDFANSVREAIETCDDLEDATTADLFTQISREIDIQLWFLESHLIGGK